MLPILPGSKGNLTQNSWGKEKGRNIFANVQVDNNEVDDEFDNFDVIVVASSSSFGPSIFPLLLIFFIRGYLNEDGETVVAADISVVVAIDAVNNFDTATAANAALFLFALLLSSALLSLASNSWPPSSPPRSGIAT